jgi:hypothetical protein
MRLFLFLVMLAGCTPEQPQTQQNPADSPRLAENGVAPSNVDTPPPPPPPPPPPASALPGLLPLTEAQVLAVLGSGVSCALGDGGQLLMVAVPGAAVINDGGRIVRLEATAKDWAALLEGGVFEKGELSVEVDVAAVVERAGEVTVYDAGTYLKRGPRGIGTSHGARWSCGA